MERLKLVAGILAVVVLIAVMPLQIWLHFYTMETISGLQVSDKERVTTGTGADTKSEYLIFTQQETFKNTDSWLALKFSSSDVYGSIQKGQTCDFKVTGLRIPFFSSYRNILTASCR